MKPKAKDVIRPELTEYLEKRLEELGAPNDTDFLVPFVVGAKLTVEFYESGARPNRQSARAPFGNADRV